MTDTNIASDHQPLLGIDEETLRTDLTVAMHKAETILRSAEDVGPGSTMNEVARAVAHLELFETVLAEVDLLTGALRSLDDLSAQGNQVVGSFDAIMLILRAAQGEMAARIDIAAS